jgi:hypothetical protein
MDGPPIRSAWQPASGLTLLDVPSITIRGTAFTVRFRRTLPPRGGCRVPHQHRTPKSGASFLSRPSCRCEAVSGTMCLPVRTNRPMKKTALRLRRWRLRIDRVDACPSRVEPSASAVGPHALEDQASASAQSAPTALLHPLKAAVPLPLSRSMPGSCEVADGLTHRAAIASARKEQRAYSTGPSSRRCQAAPDTAPSSIAETARAAHRRQRARTASCAARTRQGHRFAARYARPCRAALDVTAPAPLLGKVGGQDGACRRGGRPHNESAPPQPVTTRHPRRSAADTAARHRPLGARSRPLDLALARESTRPPVRFRSAPQARSRALLL